MTITTLQDLRQYHIETLARMKSSGKATERQIYMTEYTIEFITDRIAEKAKGEV